MTTRAAAVAGGVWAALRVPFWLRGRRLAALLRPDPAAVAGTEPPRGAARAARAAVRMLALIPGSPWRNTCLYRSAAVCLALRRHRVPVQLRIGVRNLEPPAGPIIAHAWVVRAGDGVAEPDPPDAMRPLAVPG